MDLFSSIQSNLLSPAILFFVLGIFAAVSKSDLKIPESLYTTLTIYLLITIGFKGGVAINDAGIRAVWVPGLAAMALGILIPLWTYQVLRKLGKFSVADAGAVAAHYGSVSAGTRGTGNCSLGNCSLAIVPFVLCPRASAEWFVLPLQARLWVARSVALSGSEANIVGFVERTWNGCT